MCRYLFERRASPCELMRSRKLGVQPGSAFSCQHLFATPISPLLLWIIDIVVSCFNAMSEESRSSKRPRFFPEGEHAAAGSDGAPTSVNGLKHDEEFWLEDGNIVLVSRNVAFRIYRGLLAAQSSIFADMFAAASSRADETYEGCPVIQLSESPQDLRRFLRVLLPKSRRVYVFRCKQSSN